MTNDQPLKSNREASVQRHSTGTLTLQWLTYALWGWLGVALIDLSTATLNFFLNNQQDNFSGNDVVYPISATVVLLLASIITDLLYSSRENVKDKKTGLSSLISVVHIVLFSLGAIAGLVMLTLSLVTLLTDIGSESSLLVNALSALIVTVFYLTLVLRVSLLKNPIIVRRVSRLLLTTISTIALIFGISGPLVRASQSKQDRLIESSLLDIQYAIDEYTNNKSQLPSSLNELTFNSGTIAPQAIEQGLIDYRPNSEPQTNDRQFYQLCVNYRFSRNNPNTIQPMIKEDNASSGVSSYDPGSYRIDPYNHPSGQVCYDSYFTNYGSTVDILPSSNDELN